MIRCGLFGEERRCEWAAEVYFRAVKAAPRWSLIHMLDVSKRTHILLCQLFFAMEVVYFGVVQWRVLGVERALTRKQGSGIRDRGQ